jgi:hypothetical protein
MNATKSPNPVLAEKAAVDWLTEISDEKIQNTRYEMNDEHGRIFITSLVQVVDA